MVGKGRAETAKRDRRSRTRKLWPEHGDHQLQKYRSDIAALISAWDRSTTTSSDIQIISTTEDLLQQGPFDGDDDHVAVTPWLPDAQHHLHPWITPWTPRTVERLAAVLHSLGWTYTIIDSDQPGKRLGLGIQTWEEALAVLATYDRDPGNNQPRPLHMLIIGERTELPSALLDNLWTRLTRDGRVQGVFLAADIALRPAFEDRHTLTAGRMNVPGDCLYPPSAALRAELARLPQGVDAVATDALVEVRGHIRQSSAALENTGLTQAVTHRPLSSPQPSHVAKHEPPNTDWQAM